MASLKDISKICGVSVATVSKALNGHNDVSEETKARIRETAKRLGYSPNSAARALKTNRSMNLGVLFVDDAQSGLTHDYFAHVLDSFKREAESKGYDITFINSNRTPENSLTYLEHSRSRGFDGVIIACVDFEAEEVGELVRGEIPVVTIDHVFNNRIAIVSDNIKGMRELVTYCCGLGHQRIAYIHGQDSAVTRNRLASFYQTTASFGLSIPDEYVVEAPYRDTAASAERTRELLALPKPPTCILYPDDFSCFGGIDAIREMGLRIPEDISVAGYDGLPLARQITPKLTTIAQDTEKMGRLAAERLISLARGARTTPIEQLVVEGTLIQGRSAGRPKEG